MILKMNFRTQEEFRKKQAERIWKKRGQAITKYELSIISGLAKRTLARDLNERFFEDLQKLNYKKNSVYLLPAIVKFFIKDWIDTNK